MELGRRLHEKQKGKKKLEKDQCLIIVLAGILLCIIALPARQEDTESDLSNMISDKVIEKETEEPAGAYDEQDASAGGYAAYWENRLEEALQYVDGAGMVKVLITLKESEQRIVEKDGPEEYSDTEEQDAAGGSRTVGESRIEKSTIYTEDENGRNVPYVAKTVAPAVEGVVVIAQGAQERKVQDDIIAAIQVLFDLDANKIKIVKMKNNQ